MYFDNLSDFFHMGGHALYVWSSFGISLLLMLLNILLPWWNLRRTRSQLQRQLRREQAAMQSADNTAAD